MTSDALGLSSRADRDGYERRGIDPAYTDFIHSVRQGFVE